MKWLLKGKFKLSREQMGFTLIEIVIALSILGFIGAGFLAALNTNSKATSSLDERVLAANLVTAYFEAVKESSYDNTYPEYSSVGDNITLPTQFSVTIDCDYSNDGGTTWADSYTDETLQRITVFVSHQGKPVLSMCTYKAEK